MEFHPFDETSNIWVPTKKELFYFCQMSRYARQMNREFYEEEKNKMNVQEEQCQSTNTKMLLDLYDGISIQTFLYTLTKKSNVTYLRNGRRQIPFNEEEANLLCGLMRREGFFDAPGCTACATEKLDKEIIETMQRQLDVTRMARTYYSSPENIVKFNICAEHKPFNPNNCIPTGPQPDDNRTCYGPPVIPNAAPNYGNVATSTNLNYASNFNTLDYIADQMGVKPQGTESEAQAVPSYLESLDLNNLFSNDFNGAPSQLQYPADSKFFPKNLYTSGTSVSSDVSSVTPGSKQPFNNGNYLAQSGSIAQSRAPISIPAQTSGQNMYLNNPNGFQNAMPPIHIQNNVEINLQNIPSQANNNDFERINSINPRMNPARQELIKNTLRNLNMDMQDEVIRGNRIGRKIVGKRS